MFTNAEHVVTQRAFAVIRRKFKIISLVLAMCSSSILLKASVIWIHLVKEREREKGMIHQWKWFSVGGCDCITIFNKCEHYHIVLWKNCKSFDIKVCFFCLFAFITSIGRLIGLMLTCICTFPFISNIKLRKAELSALCRFKHFYGVHLCLLNTWWVKYFITWHYRRCCARVLYI